MKNIARNLFSSLALLSGVLLLHSCERLETVTVDSFSCQDCFQTKPDWVQFNIELTINDENPFVPLVIYVGNIEDNIIDWIDTSYVSSYWVDVAPDRYYSVKAEYKDGGAIVYAIDGDKIKLKQNTTDCDVPCYYQSGGYTDARLR